jgi:hypothetical protein
VTLKFLVPVYYCEPKIFDEIYVAANPEIITGT